MTVRRYETDDITVLWEPRRCIHSAICLRRLPGVFESGRKPWVDVSAASPGEIADTIEHCPTGALRYERPGKPERPDEHVTIVPVRNGPLVVRGPIRVVASDGTVLSEEGRVALCRCGASSNQPYCDGSHARVQFESGDPEEIPDVRAETPAAVCAPQAESFDVLEIVRHSEA